MELTGKLNLQEIKESLFAATPGPWFYSEYGIYECSIGTKPNSQDVLGYDDLPPDEEDAHLIANAPEWLSGLVAKVEQLRKVIYDMMDDTWCPLCNGYPNHIPECELLEGKE